jgi:hypothetical protein
MQSGFLEEHSATYVAATAQQDVLGFIKMESIHKMATRLSYRCFSYFLHRFWDYKHFIPSNTEWFKVVNFLLKPLHAMKAISRSEGVALLI